MQNAMRAADVAAQGTETCAFCYADVVMTRYYQRCPSCGAYKNRAEECTSAADVIRQTAGRFFACEFIKKDGSLRRMIARIGVRRHVTGEGLKFNPADRGLAVVWDAGVRGYRMVDLETLLSLRCGSLQWSAQ